MEECGLEQLMRVNASVAVRYLQGVGEMIARYNVVDQIHVLLMSMVMASVLMELLAVLVMTINHTIVEMS